MSGSSSARSNIRPLVLAAVAEGRRAEQLPRTPGVILAFPGCRVEEGRPARRQPLDLRTRLALMLAGALAGLVLVGASFLF